MAATDQKLLKGYLDSDSRVDRMRRANRFKAMQSELDQQEEEEYVEEQRARRMRAAQREEALSGELQRMKQEELKKEKLVQLVREQAPELRALQDKLKAAFVTQERNNQMADRKREKQAQATDERETMDAIVADAEKYRQEEIQKKLDTQTRLREAADIQREQIANREHLLAESRDAFRKEKSSVDALVAKVQEEDYLEALSKLEKQRSTKAQHDEFLIQRDRLKADEQARKKAEEEAIRQYMAEQNKRKESDEKLRREKEASKARILEEQSRQIASERAKKEELEMLVNEYYEEQRAAKMREDERQEKARRLRDKELMLAANEEQKRMKHQRKELQMLEEQKFRQQMMERFAEDDRVDQMNRQRRMQIKQEHARKVQELLDDKRRQREEDDARERTLQELENQQKAERAALIAEVRQQMLAEAMPKLGSTDNLPKNLLSEDEWTLLKNGQQIPGRK